ncbi:MAG: HAMP domain-containing histidine kinase [Firmicutes bacterium]|nr:HAMP domain-containing histidine kinase [Bacillota bacterium]
MNRLGLGRLGPRLFLSYLLASLAAAVSGMVAALLVPTQTYQSLMFQIMHPPAGATVREMDATLASAITAAVAVHVAISLAVAIVVSAVVAAFVSREISDALAPLVEATRRLARGRWSERVPVDRVRVQEIARLADDVNALAAALEQAERRRGLAIASIGHELRTPVMALRSYVDAASDGVLALGPGELERMARAVHRLERMAQDLAALAHAEAVERDLAVSPVAVQAILGAARDDVAAAFEAADVLLTMEGDGAARTMVLADPERLGQVLGNLLVNSLAHTPKGGHVTLGARRDGREVEIYVRDDGEGIAPDDLPHVMEPFYRGQGGSAGRTPRPGMGLGLAIASRLTKAMGGRLELESPGRGGGTLARVRLPLAP